MYTGRGEPRRKDVASKESRRRLDGARLQVKGRKMTGHKGRKVRESKTWKVRASRLYWMQEGSGSRWRVASRGQCGKREK